MRTILLSFLLFTSCFIFSQQSYKKGYFVTSKGDTIHGAIQEDVEEKLTQSINFKDETGALKTLSIADIKEFGFDGGSDFRLVSYVDPLDNLTSKTHFAKFLLEGSYQLFSFRRKDDLYFVVANKDTSYLLYDDIKTPVGAVIEKGNYQSLLYFFSRECSKLSSTAQNVIFSEEALLSFFLSLDKCNGKGSTAVVHYSKSKSQTNIILSAGGMKWDTRSDISIQALGQFVIPSVNMKASLLTGLVYLQSHHESTEMYTLSKVQDKYKTQIFEIPVLFRYDILQKMIQPYLYGGTGLVIKKLETNTTTTSLVFSNVESSHTTEDSKVGGTVIFGAGIWVRVAKNFFINVDWRYDVESHLPIAGLAYKIGLGGKK